MSAGNNKFDQMSNDDKSILVPVENTESAHDQMINVGSLAHIFKLPRNCRLQTETGCQKLASVTDKIGSNLWAVGNKELISNQ